MFWGTRAWPGSRQEAEREGDLFPFWHLWLLEKHSLRLFVASEARGDSGPVRPGQLGSEASACVGSVWKLGKGIRGRPQCTSQVSSKGHFRASQGDTLLRQARRTPVSSCPPDCKGGLPTSSPLPWGGGSQAPEGSHFSQGLWMLTERGISQWLLLPLSFLSREF